MSASEYTVTYGGEYVLTSPDVPAVIATVNRALDLARCPNSSQRRVWVEQLSLDLTNGSPLVPFCFYGKVRVYEGPYRPVEHDWTVLVGNTDKCSPTTLRGNKKRCSDASDARPSGRTEAPSSHAVCLRAGTP